MTPTIADRDLSPARVAEILEIHVNTVRLWVAQHRFVTARRTLTGRIRIKASEVRALADDSAKKY
jgi:predicted site-specific integrase-resolvase